jgi:hypothetical protein
MKRRGNFLIFLLVGVAIYAVMATILAMPLLGNHGIQERLRIDTLIGNSGRVGQDLNLTVNGSGFDAQTSFFMALDSGNQQAIITRAETFGAIHTILKNGHTLYLGSRNRKVLQFDISQPEHPKYQNKSSMTGKPTALAMSGNTLWAASGFGEIGPWGSRPYRQTSSILALASDDEGVLYAAAAKQGLLIFRPQPKENPPRKIGSLELPGSALSIAVTDRLACISAANVGLHLCDISDPENPRLISTLPWPGTNQRIAIKRNLAFLSSGNLFAVIDIQNPQHPQVLAQLPLPRARDIVITDNLALLASGNSGLLVIDITDPANPFLTGHLTPGDLIHCLAVDGNHAYLGTENTGLLVVDLKRLNLSPDWRPSTPGSHKLPESIAKTLKLQWKKLQEEAGEQTISLLPDDIRVKDTAAIGQTTYLASDFGLIIIDQNEPPHIGVLQQPFALTTEIELAGDTAYICGGKQTTICGEPKPARKVIGPGMQIFDISDPPHPRAQGFVKTDNMILKMLIRKDRAYLAVKGEGVLIVDLSDPDHPRVLGIAALPWPEQVFAGYLDIYLNDEVLYIANGRAGLHVFDVSDPADPQRVAAINSPGGWVNCLAGNQKQLFTYNFSNDLQIYDINKNPKFPRLTGNLARFSSVKNIKLLENTLEIESPLGFGISRALPLFAEKIKLHGSSQARLTFPSPLFPGDYFLYAFNNNQGQQKSPGVIHIKAGQK